ncbi:HAD-IIA family hydrolase [Cohnella pontilimi]|uniref:Acid sugar phosphatase n=1 Tax=Cohnella pontilimi TaxID=2564100 RepID=A0A4V5LSV8_9BACL|nr:HAD-IIA family hydrolase [Cohnella pontilimi]
MRLPKALLFDLDGTLYRGTECVPGAGRLISSLQQRDIPCWYVTNNSSRTPEEVSQHLNEMNIPAAPQQVITSSLAAADYAKRHFAAASAYVIGESGLRQALTKAGLHLISDADATPASVVVSGIDRDFTYLKLANAVRHMLNGAAYLLTNPDKLLPTEKGLMPGAGTIGAALTAATGISPTVIGKPSAVLMDYALKRAGVLPEETWAVGDNPFTDIAAARAAGCPSVLTLTGLCTASDWEAKCREADAFPDAVCADLDELDILLRTAASDQ